MNLLQDFLPTYFDNNFIPLAGGEISVWDTPSKGRRLNLFSTPNGGEISNPQSLNSSGRTETTVFFIESGAYIEVRDRGGNFVKGFEIPGKINDDFKVYNLLAENNVEAGQNVEAKAHLIARQNLYVDGDVIVDGKINGNLDAKEIVVGYIEVQGEMAAKKITAGEDGIASYGDIRTKGSLIVQQNLVAQNLYILKSIEASEITSPPDDDLVIKSSSGGIVVIRSYTSFEHDSRFKADVYFEKIIVNKIEHSGDQPIVGSYVMARTADNPPRSVGDLITIGLHNNGYYVTYFGGNITDIPGTWKIRGVIDNAYFLLRIS